LAAGVCAGAADGVVAVTEGVTTGDGAARLFVASGWRTNAATTDARRTATAPNPSSVATDNRRATRAACHAIPPIKWTDALRRFAAFRRKPDATGQQFTPVTGEVSAVLTGRRAG
jgi:hypothetical protein